MELAGIDGNIKCQGKEKKFEKLKIVVDGGF